MKGIFVMKHNIAPARLAAYTLLAMAFVSCSGGGGGSKPETASILNDTPCGPVQTLNGRKPAWVYHQCGNTDNIYIYNPPDD